MKHGSRASRVKNATIQEHIRSLRKQKGLRAADMARKMGISRPFYTLLEGGKRKLTAAHVEKIAGALGMSVGELYASSRPAQKSGVPTGQKPSRHIRPINPPELRKRFLPYFGEQTDDMVGCIQMWVASEQLKRKIQSHHKQKEPPDNPSQ